MSNSKGRDFSLIILLLIVGCSGSYIMEKFRPNQCYYGDNDIVLRPASYLNCTNECRSRSQCHAISVYYRMSLCKIHFDDNYEPIACHLFVFSEKKRWKEKIKTGCESTTCPNNNQKCDVINGAPQCKNSECERIPGISHGTVYGNDVRVGKKVAFTCNKDYRLIGSPSLVCRANGQWSDTLPICQGADTGEEGQNTGQKGGTNAGDSMEDETNSPPAPPPQTTSATPTTTATTTTTTTPPTTTTTSATTTTTTTPPPTTTSTTTSTTSTTTTSTTTTTTTPPQTTTTTTLPTTTTTTTTPPQTTTTTTTTTSTTTTPRPTTTTTKAPSFAIPPSAGGVNGGLPGGIETVPPNDDETTQGQQDPATTTEGEKEETTTVSYSLLGSPCGPNIPLCNPGHNLACRLGICRCKVGFILSTAQSNCVKECEGGFGQTFQIYTNKWITSDNREGLNSTYSDNEVEMTKCRNKCVQNDKCNVMLTISETDAVDCYLYAADLTKFEVNLIDRDQRNVSLRNCASYT